MLRSATTVTTFNLGRRKMMMSTTNRVVNPFTGAVATEHPFVTRDEALNKLEKANDAWPKWFKLSLDDRIARVLQGAQVFEDNQGQIAKEISECMGKPVSSAAGEVEAGVAKMRTLCSLAKEALAPVERPGDGITYRVERVPKGVIDIIAPWNYPVFTALNGVIPALLGGNAVALREQTSPTVGDWFEKAFGEFTDSKGEKVVGLVTHMKTDIPTADWLAVNCDHIKHRVFTGSVRGGREIMRTIGERAANPDLRSPFITTSLELGGCDAAYVHADADIEAATPFVVDIGRLHNSGQSCCATKRALVHPSVYDEFVTKATACIAAHKIGDPSDPATTQGPLHGGEAACMALFNMAMDAKSKGAKVIVGGEDVTSASDAEIKHKMIHKISNGWFVKPTLLVDATTDMIICKEEAFGPVLPVVRAPLELSETIELVRDSNFGLTSSIFTASANVANTYVQGVDEGTVFVNWCNDVHAHLVWSGVRLSGNGVGAMGYEGFRNLTNTRSILRSGV